ncbi:MAG: hypothetical protein AB8G86_24710 [Saprospiraceae bacterium]
MKLRIKGNSVRLRLTQSEVQQLATEGKVTEILKFGPTAFRQLNYTVQKSDSTFIGASYNLNEITVMLPTSIADDWVHSDKISLEQTINAEGEEILILIEKDFKCLKARPNEEERDMYPHPAEGTLAC